MVNKSLLNYMLPHIGLYLIVLSCFGPVKSQANEASSVNPTNIVLSNGAHATISYAYYDEDGYTPIMHYDSGLARMFDGNNDTYWMSSTKGCEKIAFFIILNKSAYVKKIEVSYRGKTIPTVGDISIEQSLDEESRFVVTPEMKLSPQQVQEISIHGNPYIGVLKAKEVDVGLNQCNVSDGRIAISELNVELSDSPTLKIEMTAKDVEARVNTLSTPEKRKKYGWHFSDDENNPDKEKYLAHLMYFGLHGDRNALGLFNSFNPFEADVGEDYSDISSWYDEDRKRAR